LSSQVAPPEMMKALEFLSANKLADVISISDGSNEGDYSNGLAEIRAQDPGELAAAAAGIPVVNATGDCGAAQNLATATGFCNHLTAGPAVATWADSPFVTAVGGVTPAYSYTGPNGQDSFSVWNMGHVAAEGAGLSQIYPQPGYQRAVDALRGTTMRALPDLTMDATHGTSQAAPQLAAVLALATQVRGGHLGAINSMLYNDLGHDPAGNGLIDVTTGDNTAYGVTGFAAKPGFDIATGWGTVDAARFVPAIAAASAHAADRDALTNQARRQLRRLSATAAARPSTVSMGRSSRLTARGFLPGHPVRIAVGGRTLASVLADRVGQIAYRLNPRALRLHRGRQVLTLTGMLLRQSVRVRVR
jgi:hypothetical protein